MPSVVIMTTLGREVPPSRLLPGEPLPRGLRSEKGTTMAEIELIVAPFDGYGRVGNQAASRSGQLGGGCTSTSTSSTRYVDAGPAGSHRGQRGRHGGSTDTERAPGTESEPTHIVDGLGWAVPQHDPRTNASVVSKERRGSSARTQRRAGRCLVAGQDAVACRGHGHDAGADGVLRAGVPAMPSSRPPALPWCSSMALTSTDLRSRARFACRPAGSRHTWVMTTPVLRNSSPACCDIRRRANIDQAG